MATAKVLKSGNSQAVRPPKAFRVTSKEVEISWRGMRSCCGKAPGRWRGHLSCLRRCLRT